jgi:hypothetical protein
MALTVLLVCDMENREEIPMKTRKLTAFFLALTLLAVPALSLAESTPSSVLDMAMGAGRSVKTTVTFEPGAMLTQDTSLSPIADLLKALRLETVTQQNEGAVQIQADLFLQDKPSLTYTEQVENGQIHIKSNLFGDKAISFTPEEYMQLFITQMEAQGTDEAVITTYKAYMEMYASLMNGELPKLPEFDEKSLQEDLVSPLTEWFTKLVSAPEVTTGTFENEKHDAATVQMVYSLSAEQIADLLTIAANWAGKDVNLDTLLAYVSTMNPDAGDLTKSKADIQESLKAMPEAFLKEAAPSIPEPFTVTTWTNDQGALVALEINAGFFGEDKTKPQDTILAGYYVKTEADGVNTEVTLDVTSGTDAFAFKVSAKDAAANDAQWQVALNVKQMGMDAFGMKLDYAGKKETTGTTVKDSWKLNAEISNFGQVQGVLLDNTTNTAPSGADVKADGKLDIYLTGQSAPAASIIYSTVTGEPVEVPAIGEDSVRPGKMTAEELQAWSQELNMSMMMQLSQIMQNLPSSVLTMINGTTTY